MATETVSGRGWTWVLIFMALGVPAVVARLGGIDLEPVPAAILFGMGIVAGAFLLSWAAEAAQVDVSASLAIAVLALIAILPEYAIEAVLAWDAGQSFVPGSGDFTKEMERVAANVTGANRLLIGVGWSAVILIFWVKRRAILDMRSGLTLELRMLAVATLLTFLIFFMGEVNFVLAFVLIAMYVYYLWVSSRQASEEPELMGPSLLIGTLPTVKRRAVVVLLFIYAAAVILIAAEPFVDALIETGEKLGIDDFILIQWVAPLASESPEIIVAVLFSLRANPTGGLTTLISAEVNQLTVLIGSMALIFSISAGDLLSFPLDSRQSAEFLLTAAMSAFAILLIAPRLISWKAGLVILVLFVAHLFFTDQDTFFTDQDTRTIFAYIFLGLAAGLVVLDRKRVRQLVGVGPPLETGDQIDETATPD